jgi:VanZ family protein
MKYRKYLLILPLLFAVLLNYYLSSLTDLPNLSINNVDKILHFGLYLFIGVTIIIFLTFFFRNNFRKNKIIIYTCLIGFILGAIDEIHQIWVPERNASFFDWIADAVGIIASLFLINIIFKIILKFKKKNSK